MDNVQVFLSFCSSCGKGGKSVFGVTGVVVLKFKKKYEQQQIWPLLSQTSQGLV